MLADIEFSPRAKELYQQIKTQIYFTSYTLEIFWTYGSPENGVEIKFRTNTPNPKASWLVGKGNSIEAALEDYAHSLAVRLDV